MTPSRPYLIRALYEWIVDNNLTPYMLIDAEGDGITAPMEYVDNGTLVLNISPKAVRHMDIGNENVLFSARFRGEPMDVVIPTHRVLAIYARENGQGMLFGEQGDGPEPPPDGSKPDKSDRPVLRVVK